MKDEVGLIHPSAFHLHPFSPGTTRAPPAGYRVPPPAAPATSPARARSNGVRPPLPSEENSPDDDRGSHSLLPTLLACPGRTGAPSPAYGNGTPPPRSPLPSPATCPPARSGDPVRPKDEG